MPTPIDRALQSKNLFLGFAGIITAVTAWSIFGGDMFPQEADPKGEPESWSEEDLKRWLNKRNLMAGNTATKEELVARVRANLRAPRA